MASGPAALRALEDLLPPILGVEQDGTWARIEHRLQSEADAAGDLDWRAQVDSTIVRAHQNAAGARRKQRDRRSVTLRITPDIKEQAVQFFLPAAERVDAMMREHPEELLLSFVALLDQLHGVLADVLENLETPPLIRKDPSQS